ncbi:hypothetical protein PFAS1_09275 [Pseudomonas frederiksbergensis]|uniref:hypothetical protein n=1 Tax=Pseudomonas frederiksbergensis TaxID=104087 RepID=UPI0009588B3B|nr:hypothetical protein [Pseudomonas frederiksbergensis]APV39528.1 hypothetical protein PFAS1_09275 [Pseudomonas frederiksbergensis]
MLAKAIEQALRSENLAQEGLRPRILRCIEEFGHWAFFCFMGLAKSESYVARKTVIASRLVPTLDLWRTQIPCGSQPAGDGSDAVEPIEPYSMSLKDLLPDADHQRKKNPAFAGFFVRPTEAAHSAV